MQRAAGLASVTDGISTLIGQITEARALVATSTAVSTATLVLFTANTDPDANAPLDVVLRDDAVLGIERDDALLVFTREDQAMDAWPGEK